MRGCTGCAAAPGTTTEAAIARRAVLRVRQIVRAMATADVSCANGAYARLKVPVFKRTPACSPAGAVPELPWCFFLLIT